MNVKLSEEETATEVITMFKDKLAELTEFTAENIQPISNKS